MNFHQFKNRMFAITIIIFLVLSFVILPDVWFRFFFMLTMLLEVLVVNALYRRYLKAKS